MNQVKPNKNEAVATDQKIVLGVAKYFAKLKTLSLAGTSYTPNALKGVFQGEIDANNSLDTARAQLKEQVASTRAIKAKATTARKALKAYVLGNYGVQAVQMLEDLGMSVPKPLGRRSAEVKAAAVVKAVATKEANGTGKKKKPAPVASAPSTAASAQAPALVAQPNGVAPMVAAPAATHSQ